MWPFHASRIRFSRFLTSLSTIFFRFNFLANTCLKTQTNTLSHPSSLLFSLSFSWSERLLASSYIYIMSFSFWFYHFNKPFSTSFSLFWKLNTVYQLWARSGIGVEGPPPTPTRQVEELKQQQIISLPAACVQSFRPLISIHFPFP